MGNISSLVSANGIGPSASVSKVTNCFFAGDSITGSIGKCYKAPAPNYALSSTLVNGSTVQTNPNGDEKFSTFQTQSWINANLPTWDFENVWDMSDKNSINKGLPILRFSPSINYSITASAGANGTISPSGATVVAYGGNQAYTITPNIGSEIDEVLVDNVAVPAANYTFSNVTANHTISVTFKQSQYTITASSGANGTISPSGETTVAYGGSQAYTITPNTGYEIAEVLVNGNAVTQSGESYTLTNVTADQSISVSFKEIRIFNPNLENIIAEGASLSPLFDTEIVDYRILMPCNQNSITINFSAQSSFATMNIDGESFGNSESKRFTLQTPGQKSFVVTVNDQGKTKLYNITLVKPFDNVVLPVWDDVLSVINIPQNNGGYSFTNYQWYRDTEFTQIMTGETKGNLYLLKKDNSNTNYSVWLKTSTGISSFGCRKTDTQLRSSAIKVYPNPTVHTVSVEDEEWVENSEACLYDMSGKLIHKQQVNSSTVELNMSNYNQGVYLLKLNGKTITIIKK